MARPGCECGRTEASPASGAPRPSSLSRATGPPLPPALRRPELPLPPPGARSAYDTGPPLPPGLRRLWPALSGSPPGAAVAPSPRKLKRTPCRRATRSPYSLSSLPRAPAQGVQG